MVIPVVFSGISGKFSGSARVYLRREYESRSFDPAPGRRADHGGARLAEAVWLVRRARSEGHRWISGTARLYPRAPERAVRRIGGVYRWTASGTRPRHAARGYADHQRDVRRSRYRACEAWLFQRESGLRVQSD